MSSVELHIIYGNPESEEWENVDYFIIDDYIPIDFEQGIEHIKERQKNDWKTVVLPNRESIDVMAIKNEDDFTLNIRQDMTPLSQISCNSLASLCFRTLAGRDINIQIHPEGTHKNVPDYQNA